MNQDYLNGFNSAIEICREGKSATARVIAAARAVVAGWVRAGEITYPPSKELVDALRALDAGERIQNDNWPSPPEWIREEAMDNVTRTNGLEEQPASGEFEIERLDQERGGGQYYPRHEPGYTGDTRYEPDTTGDAPSVRFGVNVTW